MVFEHDEIKGVNATVRTATGKKKFHCSLSACPSPTCTCQTLTINFTPMAQPEKEPLSFEIDFKREGLSKTFKKSESKESLKFAKTVLSQMKESDFVLLANLFSFIKNDQIESSATDTSYFPFDYADVESKRLCYGYKSVFPFAIPLYFEIDEKTFFITDQYCVRENCGCTKISLDITEIVRIKNKTRSKDICYIDLDYKKRAWKMTHQVSSDPSMKEIRAAIEKDIPDFYEQVKNRHKKLGRTYSYNKSEEWEAPKPRHVSEETGRNDPCPCGSGKKYKKCCM